ncbi:MAG: UDP-2,3-diacylglucosamine diphosphatase [bacterium]
MSSHFFISDAHLGSRIQEAEQRLAQFLYSIKNRAESLYILGDLFEFWFEYRQVVPSAGLGVVAPLAALRRAGTRVVFLRGNHDVWYKGVLKREFGFEGFYDELCEVIDGKRVFLCHGDALDKQLIPRLFRRLMRSKVDAGLYSIPHPDVGVGLARWIARRSRERGAKPTLIEAMRGFAQTKIEQGFDVVIMGHSHIPEILEFDKGVYLNTGDWIKNFTFGLIENGRVNLKWF